MLYRISINIRASRDHPSCIEGQRGIAVTWIRERSEDAALACAKVVFEEESYSSQSKPIIRSDDGNLDLDTADLWQGNGTSEDRKMRADYLAGKRAVMEEKAGMVVIWFVSRSSDQIGGSD